MREAEKAKKRGLDLKKKIRKKEVVHNNKEIQIMQTVAQNPPAGPIAQW